MTLNKINIAIAGATGYVGLDLVFLLSKHPNIKINYLCAQKSVGKKINTIDTRIKKKLPMISDLKKVKWENVDLLFLSLPNGEAQKTINSLFKYTHLKFIDLSADFRITNVNEYKYWYKIKHSSPKLIKESIYSISEFVKKEIKKYRIISNPGCYPTSIQLPLVPLIKKKLIKLNDIIIDSKSGYSGAGKNYKKKFKHKDFYNSVYAYSTSKHRHMSELDQEFNKLLNKKINYTFNPHLLPTFRGIISSIYLELPSNSNISKIHKELKIFYKKNIFIKILKINTPIGTGNVLNTNNCEISVCKTRNKNKIIILSSIDNLIKGASGQAVQNMNLIYDFKENSGL